MVKSRTLPNKASNLKRNKPTKKGPGEANKEKVFQSAATEIPEISEPSQTLGNDSQPGTNTSQLENVNPDNQKHQNHEHEPFQVNQPSEQDQPLDQDHPPLAQIRDFSTQHPPITLSSNIAKDSFNYQLDTHDLFDSQLNHVPVTGYMHGPSEEIPYVSLNANNDPYTPHPGTTILPSNIHPVAFPQGPYFVPHNVPPFPHPGPVNYGDYYVLSTTPMAMPVTSMGIPVTSMVSTVPMAILDPPTIHTPENPTLSKFHFDAVAPTITTIPPSVETYPNTNIPMVYHDHNIPNTNTRPPNKQVAPRSNNLYRVGPPFLATKIHRPFFCHATHQQVLPIMSSRIDRGFERGEAGNWIGYKRNYVTVVSSFVFQGWSFGMFLTNRYFVVDDSTSHTNPPTKLDIKYFAFAISVKCNDPDVKAGLVQHTPKRDKGPKYATPTYPAVPGGTLPDHRVVSLASNKKNGERVANMQRIFNFERNTYYCENGVAPADDTSILKEYPGDLITKVARFERIQFTKSLRVEPHGAASRYFTLVIELLGVLSSDSEYTETVVLATSETVPLLVRGRSASMYPSEKTSGYRETGELSGVE